MTHCDLRKGDFYAHSVGISGAQIHLKQREFAGYWEEGNHNWKQRRDQNWPISTAKRCLPTLSLWREYSQHQKSSNTSSVPAANGDVEANYWSGEVFSVMSAAAHESISRWRSPGLTFGLRTRFHSLAPPRNQLSWRNAGKISASSQLASKSVRELRQSGVQLQDGTAGLKPCPALKTILHGLDPRSSTLSLFRLCSLLRCRLADTQRKMLLSQLLYSCW